MSERLANGENPSRTNLRTLWLGVALLHVCVIALVVIALYQSRVEALRSANNITTSLTHAVEQNLAAVIERVDWGLQGVEAEMERQSRVGRVDAAAINAVLAEQDSRDTDVMGFHVYGPDGKLLYGIHGVHNPKADISDRMYFKRLRDTPDMGLLISPPMKGVATGEMVVGMARRITLADGRFGGVVRGAIAVQRLSQMFAWFHPGDHGAAQVFDAQHVMLFRYPMPPDGLLGTDTVISDHARQLIDSGAVDGEYQVVSPVDHLRKLAVFRKIGSYPWYAVVGFAEQDYLSQWHHDAMQLSLFALVFLVLSTAAVRQIVIRMTQAQQASDALRHSNDRYERLVDSIPWGVFTMRIKANGVLAFEYASPRMCQLLDVSAEHLLHDASTAIGMIHPDDVDDFLALHGELAETLGPFQWKGRFNINGQVRTFNIASIPTPLPNGESLWNGVLADVTEQEAAENRLRETDEKLRALYELSPLGIALNALTGQFVDFNESFREITGYEEDELKALDYWKLTPDKYRDEERAQLESLETTGYYGPYRKEYINKAGRLVPVQLNGVRITGGDGAQYIWSIVQDIGDRLRSEEELRLSLERFRLMVNSVKDYAIFLLDAEGRVLTWNEGAQRQRQYRAEDIIGQPFSRFYTSDDNHKNKAGMLLRAAQDQGTVQDEGWRIRQDGSRFWADLTISCLRGEDGEVSGYVNICRDISDRKLAQDTMRLMSVLFEKSLEGIVITDQIGRIIQVNPAFLAATGYEISEVLGHNPRILKSGHHDISFYSDMWNSIHTSGHWIGEVWNKRKSGEIYPDLLSITAVTNEQGLVTNYLGITTDLSRVKNHERQLEHAAHYDSLTGTANRSLLAERMEQALAGAKRDGTMLAVLYLDLDGFKSINDTYGHVTGDRLLLEISRRIQGCVRGSDTVARLGGDEFAVLLDALHRVEEYTVVLETLLKTIAVPLVVEGQEFMVTASIGVSVSQSGEGDADTLLRHADRAMYLAKDAGRNRYHFYDAAQDVLTREHFQSLQRIVLALESGEFELYFQPKVDMHTNQVVGAEALIRWNHPERGLVPPMEFLPLIENSEYEIAVGEWVIDAALRQLRAWQQVGLKLEVSINISASHLQSETFIRKLQAKLADYPDLPPGLLEIEILETAALQDLTKAKEIIAQCNSMGVGFALDDFGTGYSSLAYLRSIPAGTLKIDQTFVRDMLEDQGDRAIVDGIIVLARAFDLKVVAEGVETTDHYRALVKMGCQIGQGYGIARPMPVAKFNEWYQALSETAQPSFAR